MLKILLSTLRCVFQRRKTADEQSHLLTRVNAPQQAAISADGRENPIWQSLAIGVVIGVPLTIMGELFLSAASPGFSPLRLLGQIMTGPGEIYRVLTQGNVFASPSTLCLYLLVQAFYYTALVFAMLTLVQRRRP